MMVKSLADRLKERGPAINPLETEFIQACGRRILEALAFLHDEASIVYCDLSLDQIMFRRFLPGTNNPDPASLARMY